MLEFHLSTILWTVINLLVLYLFLRKFLFGRINAVLEKREAMVKQNLDAAEESNQQAQAFKTKYEEKLTGAMQEADRIMAEAQNRAQRAYEARIAEAEKDAKQVRQEAEKQMDTERAQMLEGAREEVASLALLAAAKVAQRSMDGKDEQAFVDSFLAEVGKIGVTTGAAPRRPPHRRPPHSANPRRAASGS